MVRGLAENGRMHESQKVNLSLSHECMRVAPLVRITLGSMKRSSPRLRSWSKSKRKSSKCNSSAASCGIGTVDGGARGLRTDHAASSRLSRALSRLDLPCLSCLSVPCDSLRFTAVYCVCYSASTHDNKRGKLLSSRNQLFFDTSRTRGSALPAAPAACAGHIRRRWRDSVRAGVPATPPGSCVRTAFIVLCVCGVPAAAVSVANRGCSRGRMQRQWRSSAELRRKMSMTQPSGPRCPGSRRFLSLPSLRD